MSLGNKDLNKYQTNSLALKQDAINSSNFDQWESGVHITTFPSVRSNY